MGLDADRREHEGSLLGIGQRAEPADLDKIGHVVIRDLIGGAFPSSRLSHPGDYVDRAGGCAERRPISAVYRDCRAATCAAPPNSPAAARFNCSVSAAGQPYPEGSRPPPRSRLIERVFNRFYAFS